MQPIAWYIRRLRSMSTGEVAWRIRSLVRDRFDRYRFGLGMYPSAQAAGLGGNDADWPMGFRVSDVKPGEWLQDKVLEDEHRWQADLVVRAEKILQHHLSFFDLEDCFLGDPIDWNRDHSAHRQCPTTHAMAIDYRDFSQVGDCKLVWEPNRHHHLVVLARAYRATGEVRFAKAVTEQLASWIEQNPFGTGMNWRSPLELAVRLINWVWALDLIRESGLLQGALQKRVLHSAYLHCWETARKFSQGSSANNHLVGEAAGVFVATSYFPMFPEAERWREESRAILEREILLQSYRDGCTREQALGYEFFVLQFYLISGLVGRWTDQEFSQEYWDRIEKMLEFSAALAEGGRALPMFGDRDDGYVLDLGASPDDITGLFSVAALIFSRTDFAVLAGKYSEPSRWLFGREGRDKFLALCCDPETPHYLTSKSFSDSGYYLLQTGAVGKKGAISVLFDCGELGFGAIAAHGHADALSFVLRVNGLDVFVDPGTYDYFTYPEWRNYFRSTRAHNTVEVDGLDQSEMLGPFLWGKRATATCLDWAPGGAGGIVEGEHDGYARLADPATHRRRLELDGARGLLEITDYLGAERTHSLALYFHLGKTCRLKAIQGNYCELELEDGTSMTLELDPALIVETLIGSEEPIGGWLSNGYHRRTATTTIIARGQVSGMVSLVSRLTIQSG